MKKAIVLSPKKDDMYYKGDFCSDSKRLVKHEITVIDSQHQTEILTCQGRAYIVSIKYIDHEESPEDLVLLVYSNSPGEAIQLVFENRVALTWKIISITAKLPKIVIDQSYHIGM